MRRLIAGLVLVSTLAGCAGAIQHELVRSSARAIVPTPNPDSLTISDVHKDWLGNATRWVVTTRSGVYDCTLEQGEPKPICAKREP